jgi:hypothetical protein
LHGGGGAVLNVNNLSMASGSTLGVYPGGFNVNVAAANAANITLADNISIIVASGAGLPVGTYSEFNGGPTSSGPASGNGHIASVSFADETGNIFMGSNGVLLPAKVNLGVGVSGYLPESGAMSEFVLMDGLNVQSIVSAAGVSTAADAILSIFGNDGKVEMLGAVFQLTFNGDKLLMTQMTYSTTIPEPGTYALCGGLVVLGVAVWRKRQRK